MNKILLLMFFSILNYSMVSFAEEAIVDKVDTIKPTTPTELLKNSFNIVSDAAKKIRKEQIECRKKRLDNCPPIPRWISDSTKKFSYAQYMKELINKIEQHANSKKSIYRGFYISGNVEVDIAINPDGTLNAINILSKQNNKVIENTIIELTKAASPFEHFSEEMKKEISVLHIIRSWQFKDWPVRY